MFKALFKGIKWVVAQAIKHPAIAEAVIEAVVESKTPEQKEK